jgi:hypothetical protein
MTDLNLTLVVSNWRQSVRHYPSIKVEGRGLTAHCRWDEESLTVSDGTPLATIEVELSMFETWRMNEELSKVQKGALGQLHYSPLQPAEDDIPELKAFVHGWLCLNSQLHQDLWEQVLTGGYSNCRIQLSAGPIESRVGGWRWNVAKDPSRSISSASITFRRELPNIVEQKPKRRSFWS